MPSIEHAAFVESVRISPEVVPSLLTELGVPLPPFERVTVQESVLDQVAPTELRADLVLELVHVVGPAEMPTIDDPGRMLTDCTDPDQILHWLKRAIVATSPADVFD